MTTKNNNNSKSQTKKKMEKPEAYRKEDIERLSNSYVNLLTKSSSKYPKAKFLCKICTYHIDDLNIAFKHIKEERHNKCVMKLEKKVQLTYMPEPTINQIKSIDDCLMKLLSRNIFIKQTEKEYREKTSFEIIDIIRSINSNNTAGIYGSLITGLSMNKKSDVNLCLEIDSKDNSDKSYLEELKIIEKEVNSKLKMKTELKKDKYSSGLFCRDSKNTVYHISSNCSSYILTSNLIRIYLSIDKRAEQLAKLFRYFANEAFIDVSKDGLFPSHVFGLMVIFYLQQLSLPILPNLHKLAKMPDIKDCYKTQTIIRDELDSYVNDIGIINNYWKPKSNPATLGELWVGLLRFYSAEFDAAQYVVSILSCEPVLKSKRNICNKRISVEDPSDYKRNLLFNWNSNDVVEFFHDQLQAGFSYFATPQLTSGPAFVKVAYYEPNLEKLSKTLVTNPKFKLDDVEAGFELFEGKLTELYESLSGTYDTTKWPTLSFIRSCLGIILHSFIDSDDDIFNMLCLLEIKISLDAYLIILNLNDFKEYAKKLFSKINERFKDYCLSKDTWMKPEQNTDDVLHTIKKASQIFSTELLKLTNSDSDGDADEMVDGDDDSIDILELNNEEPDEILVEDIPIEKEEVDNNPAGDGKPNQDIWKIPIAFKNIAVQRKGKILSSTKDGFYNKEYIDSLKPEDFNLNFNKIPMSKCRLSFECSFCNTKGHRKEACNYAVPRFENLNGCINVLDEKCSRNLKDVLLKTFDKNNVVEELTKNNLDLFHQISEIISKIHSTVKPKIFGSTDNGFMTLASDLDICLEYYNASGVREELTHKQIGQKLLEVGKEIQRQIPGMYIEYVLRAKVPIVKFYVKDYIHGDISVNNTLAIHNTKMLRLYSDLNPIAKQLGTLLKFIIKTCEIGDASQGTLSSYAYIILLIHYLQKRKVLPVLQEMHEGAKPVDKVEGWNIWYQADKQYINEKWQASTKYDLAYLWLDFFHYYAVEFEINDQVVCIRKSSTLYKMDKNWQSSYFAIEDPFDLSHNLGGCLSLEKCRTILQYFAHVLELHSNRDLLIDDRIKFIMEPKFLRIEENHNSNKVCFSCNKTGHFKNECPKRGNRLTPMKQNNPATKNENSAAASSVNNQANCFNLSSDRVLTFNHSHVDLKSYGVPFQHFATQGGIPNLNDLYFVPISIQLPGNNSITIPMLSSFSNDNIDKLVKNAAKLKDIKDSSKFISMTLENMKQIPLCSPPTMQSQQNMHNSPDNTDCIPVIQGMMNQMKYGGMSQVNQGNYPVPQMIRQFGPNQHFMRFPQAPTQQQSPYNNIHNNNTRNFQSPNPYYQYRSTYNQYAQNFPTLQSHNVQQNQQNVQYMATTPHRPNKKSQSAQHQQQQQQQHQHQHQQQHPHQHQNNNNNQGKRHNK